MSGLANQDEASAKENHVRIKEEPTDGDDVTLYIHREPSKDSGLRGNASEPEVTLRHSRGDSVSILRSTIQTSKPSSHGSGSQDPVPYSLSWSKQGGSLNSRSSGGRFPGHVAPGGSSSGGAGAVRPITLMDLKSSSAVSNVHPFHASAGLQPASFSGVGAEKNGASRPPLDCPICAKVSTHTRCDEMARSPNQLTRVSAAYLRSHVKWPNTQQGICKWRLANSGLGLVPVPGHFRDLN